MFKTVKKWWLELIKEEYILEVWFSNDIDGKTKKEFRLKSISKRTNNHIKAVFLDGTPLEIKTVQPFDFCIRKIY
tara:strand:- start:16 stop:240 length:225 start_codon:yes stop_codon:yes gene_type:complete